MRWTLRATALGLAVALPLAAGIGQATRHELAERFLFITGDTANTEAWRFLQDTRVPRAREAVHPAGPAPRGRAGERLTSGRALA
jgi:hypothetical protein